MNGDTTPRPAGARTAPFGVYRRAVRITARAGLTTAEMEDDVHHFELALRHEAGIITDVEAVAHRTPYAICPGAIGQLTTLRGLSAQAVRSIGAGPRAEHCLHLYDLVVLAADHVSKQGFERLYRIEVDHDAAPPLARVWRDGAEVLNWGVEAGRVRGSKFDGVAFSDLARHLASSEPDEAEAALILRRASLISFVRMLDLDAYPAASAIRNGPANCYAKQPIRVEQAVRSVGSSRDFHGQGAWPLASAVIGARPL